MNLLGSITQVDSRALSADRWRPARHGGTMAKRAETVKSDGTRGGFETPQSASRPDFAIPKPGAGWPRRTVSRTLAAAPHLRGRLVSRLPGLPPQLKVPLLLRSGAWWCGGVSVERRGRINTETGRSVRPGGTAMRRQVALS
jgi:hypothetical protein